MPQEQLHSQIHEHNFDVHTSVFQDTVEATSLIPQERVQSQNCIILMSIQPYLNGLRSRSGTSMNRSSRFSASEISFMSDRRSSRKLCSASVTGTCKARFAWLSSPRTRLFGKLEHGCGVNTARWRETDLTRTVLEWWFEDLHGRQPAGAPCGDYDVLLCRDCCDPPGGQHVVI